MLYGIVANGVIYDVVYGKERAEKVARRETEFMGRYTAVVELSWDAVA